MSFKKFEDFSSRESEVNSYKFKVEMIVSLYAENEEMASELLDANGGFVIKRQVELIDTKPIHSTKD